MIRRAAVVACVVSAALPAAAHAGTGFRIAASLHPATVPYGDPVIADVEIDYDPSAVDPSSIRLQPHFGPYGPAAVPAVQHLRDGAVRFRYSLLCLTEGCLPDNAVRLLRFRPVTATARAGSTTVSATASWPALRISSRLTAADRTGGVRFRYPATPPAPSYRIAPGTLAAGLIALAAVCALAAVALVARELTRRAAGRPQPRLSPFELAIAYVRDSAARAEPDRRRALELLSEAADGKLAADAADRAWSEPAPTPAAAGELADRAAETR